MWQHIKLSRSIPEIHLHVAGTLSNQPTNKQTTNNSSSNNTNTTDFNCCQELEEEVNLYYEELVLDKGHDQLLSSQLQRLLVCFDVYLETEEPDVSAPVEIPKEKVIPRVYR